MAAVRTILPRKGLIQPQHGLTGYESDQDANWALLDANVAFMSDLVDLQYRDFGLNGVVSGFVLSVSPTLTPGLSVGVLYAQGVRYAPQLPPSLSPAPGGAASYLFYNSLTGFYYQATPVAGAAGDALIGQVTTSSTAVTGAIAATKIYGRVPLAPTAAGNFTVPHWLGRAPLGVVIQMTSSGSIWFQATTAYDATNLYLVASAGGITGQAQVW